MPERFVLGLLGLEHAHVQRAGMHTSGINGIGELGTDTLEDPLCGREHLGRCHSQPVDELGLDSTFREFLGELRACAVDHDRREPNMVHEDER